MPRAVDGSRRKNRRKKILKQVKGFWGRRKSNFRTAKDALTKAGIYAYRDRRRKKRDFRALWIIRISAACREKSLSYSRFINGLLKAEIAVNRKALANLAIEDREAFDLLVDKAKEALAAADNAA